MKFLIIDRDGVLVSDKVYVHKIEDLEILPGVIEGLKKFQNAGFRFVVVTNQAGIARGLFTTEDMNKFNNELLRRLKAKGIKIEKIYHCPHHPEFSGNCECRKPNVGMARLAEKEFEFDASNAIFIGDKDSDTKLGKNCGGLTVLIKNGQYPNSIKPRVYRRGQAISYCRKQC